MLQSIGVFIAWIVNVSLTEVGKWFRTCKRKDDPAASNVIITDYKGVSNMHFLEILPTCFRKMHEIV